MAYHPFRNIPLKMLAVALSALLWYTVSRDDVVERNIRVPLEFQNIPQGLELTGDPPSTVSARVRGASSVLSRLDSGDVVAVLTRVHGSGTVGPGGAAPSSALREMIDGINKLK